MCLIFVKPKNAKNFLTYDRFSNALENNPHSVGIIVKNKNNVIVTRFIEPLQHKESIWNIIKDAEEYAIHFRYATHGKIDITNTHPFTIVKGLWMMHNGVMNEFGNMNKEYSDTKNFVEYYLKPIIEKEGVEILKCPEFKETLKRKIGLGNKLLFIDNEFNITIINEDVGVWREGCWLSNEYSILSHKTPKYYHNLPTDGTANIFSNYSWFNDSVEFEDDMIYDAHTDVNIFDLCEYIAEEIEQGHIQGEYIEYVLQIEEDLDSLGLNKQLYLNEIAKQVRDGCIEGEEPFSWVIESRVIDDYIDCEYYNNPFFFG
jgi:predicted glutamine amidotransferase